MTPNEARAWILEMRHVPDLIEWIKIARNVHTADIDSRGNVHVGAPQSSWLSDDALVETVEAILRGV